MCQYVLFAVKQVVSILFLTNLLDSASMETGIIVWPFVVQIGERALEVPRPLIILNKTLTHSILQLTIIGSCHDCTLI